jgi:hypothetical protein
MSWGLGVRTGGGVRGSPGLLDRTPEALWRRKAGRSGIRTSAARQGLGLDGLGAARPSYTDGEFSRVAAVDISREGSLPDGRDARAARCAIVRIEPGPNACGRALRQCTYPFMGSRTCLVSQQSRMSAGMVRESVVPMMQFCGVCNEPATESDRQQPVDRRAVFLKLYD